jgi:hypothetical protein
MLISPAALSGAPQVPRACRNAQAAPHPGALGLAATGFGDRTSVVLDRHVYADDAQARAEAERDAWAACLA